MRIVIAGGGICGLTLALAAKTAGLTPILIEQRPNILVQSFGGGIGLWPPSQLVFEQLGILSKLQKLSGVMPKASYLNQKGQKLGQPSQYFSERYRILCIGRQTLNRVLYEQCLSKAIQIKTGLGVADVISSKDGVKVQLTNGQYLSANALIGADGINSTVRNLIMKERKRPEIKPFHCGYAYFRAVVDLSKHNGYDENSSNWHDYAFESWGEQKRFGYVPLKAPQTFWFVAIPINKYGLTEYYGSHTCSEQQKKWILELFEHWKAPISIKKLIQITPASTILRTDIRKIKGVTEFPWNSKNNNILILGDAANATAPNLAQGAGLAIQSAWDLISMVDFRNKSGVQEFMKKRRERAQTVQNMADLVAKVGQLDRPLSDVRNFIMSTATKYLGRLQQNIFESVVRYSLGGTSGSPYWIAARNINSGFYSNQLYTSSLLGKIVGKSQYRSLPTGTQLFRGQLIGEGSGKVTVKASTISKIFGLSSSMQNANFGAYVDTYFDQKTNAIRQKWTRVFGQGQKGAFSYSTIHRNTPYFGSTNTSGLALTESLGTNIFLDLIRFGYNINLDKNKIHYKSAGLWLWNYKMPISQFFLPRSEWIEEQTQQGWRFDGTISLPKVIGGSTLFKYDGFYKPKLNSPRTEKRVLIAGGSGFIGQIVARQFYKNGWNVTIISRKSRPISELPFAKIEQWNISSPHFNHQRQVSNIASLLNDQDVLINLSGQNPAGLRWTDAKKKKILESRLQSINVLTDAIQKSNNKQLTFLQISAAGIYGQRNQQILNDDSTAGSTDTFRINTVKQIEKLTSQKSNKKAIILRIGHVLGSKEGIFSFLKLASLFRVKKFGNGGQYIPWIHVEDCAKAMYFVADNSQKFEGKTINIASPEHHTYDELYKQMGNIHNRSSFLTIPEFLLKLALGELSSVLLQSQRMNPKLLLDQGFEFSFKQLSKALSSKELL